MSRPWTPGPWFVDHRSIYALKDKYLINTIYAQFQHCHGGASEVENCANALLASKAPEMAELLIRLVEGNIGGENFYDLLLDATHVLNAVGYIPDVEEIRYEPDQD